MDKYCCLHAESGFAGLQRGGKDRHAKNAQPSATAYTLTAMPESDRSGSQVVHPQAFIRVQCPFCGTLEG